ncbi:sn-glycerol-3-phosphate ABC transporter ATP-binding protein UgpC [Granulosicoccaceae sp. 1_MG-2023]|nr:sn-glycerol-3-phosphate ABC transporter ATP-binding protein UgpC [Granulosicoccaceae sp. 1_MG-2023]
MQALTINNVRKRYGDVEVLKGIDLDIAAGQFLILVGPSGCGKSTLLNMIAGLETVSDGTISIGDRDVTDLSPKDRDIAMVFQSYALYPNMTVRGNIAFGMEIRKVPKAEQDEIVTRVSTMLQIDHLLDRKPGQLSGGQRQRVAMGRALARDPSVFLFDEPLSNLDAKLRVEMRSEIKQLHQRTGTTVVYVTHDQIEAMTLGDAIAVMKDGEVQQFGTPQEIYDSPANLFVAGFMGSTPINFIPCTVHSQDGVPAVTLVSDHGEVTVRLPHYAALQSYEGQEIIIGLRPEQVTQVDSAGAPPGTITFSAPVTMLEPTGPDTLVSVALNGQRVIGRAHPDAVPPVGQSMTLQANFSRAVAFDPKTELLIQA